jgi:hypothetical protein
MKGRALMAEERPMVTGKKWRRILRSAAAMALIAGMPLLQAAQDYMGMVERVAALMAGPIISDKAFIDQSFVRVRPGVYEALVFDLEAPVHDDFEPCGTRPGRGFRVADAELQPQVTYALRLDQRKNFSYQARYRIDAAENVDHFEWFVDIRERRLHRLAENGVSGYRRIDGNDPVPGLLQVTHDAVAGAIERWAGANHGDGVRASEHPDDRPVIRSILVLAHWMYHVLAGDPSIAAPAGCRTRTIAL